MLPANLAAERTVLGAVIEDDGLLADVLAAGLTSEGFFVTDHQRIFQAVLMLHQKNEPVDYVTVTEELGNRNQDCAAIADLLHGVVVHRDHVLHHVRILRKKARLRQLLKLGEWLMKNANDEGDPEAILSEISRRIESCREK